MTKERYHSLLRKLVRTIERTEQEVFPKFPFYRNRDSVSWNASNRGSWLAGFWLGSCWLAEYFSEKEMEVRHSAERRNQLSSIIRGDSVFHAMNAWYGFGPAWRLAQDPDAQRRLVSYQSCLELLFQPWGGFSFGSEMGGGSESHQAISVDPCAAIYELSSIENWAQKPYSHSLRVSSALLDSEGRFYSQAKIKNQQEAELAWRGVGQAGEWERGQCWGMLALCSATKQMNGSEHQTYIEQATKACEYWWRRYWLDGYLQRDDGADRLDPSAALMAAIAMFKLNENSKGGQWEERGRTILDWLINSPYIVEGSDSLRFIACRYKTNKSNKEQELVEMPYGYFFLFQALLIAIGVIHASDF